ncbi:MAG: response regulator transcription factor, partial [Leptolyngbyaceae cyanobacterium bins.59]|nr:response regulator transcription factor [Leptolyngbyaceae cyanobacterium bins.59]
MSDRVFNVLLLDADPVFRLGLRRSLEERADLQVVGEAATAEELRQLLLSRVQMASLPPSRPGLAVDVLTLDLTLDGSGLAFCQRFKVAYPQVSLLLISLPQPREAVMAALRVGVRGYCPKGSSVEELLTAVQQVAAGEVYLADGFASSLAPIASLEQPLGPFALIRQRTRNSGLQQIDRAIAEVTRQLERPGIPWADRLVLEGQRRELRTARWLVNRLLATPPRPEVPPPAVVPSTVPSVASPSVALPSETRWLLPVQTAVRLGAENPSPNRAHPIQSALIDATVAKLQLELTNRTPVPLELDILRDEKKRELLYSILRRLEEILSELR